MVDFYYQHLTVIEDIRINGRRRIRRKKAMLGIFMWNLMFVEILLDVYYYYLLIYILELFYYWMFRMKFKSFLQNLTDGVSKLNTRFVQVSNGFKYYRWNRRHS